MKLCPKCDRTLPLTSFRYRNKALNKRQSYCRDCSNSYWRDWYGREENRKRQLAAVALRRRRIRDENRRLVRALKDQPCADCGLRFPTEAMDFDHLEEKTAEISRMVYANGVETLRIEITRCEVVCANCHRIRTAKRRATREGALRALESPTSPRKMSQRDVAQLGSAAAFGTLRSSVRIRPSRLKLEAGLFGLANREEFLL